MTKQVGKAGPGSPNRLPRPGKRGGDGGGDDRRRAPDDGANTGANDISCREVRPLLRDFHLGRLTDRPALHRAVDRHLDSCQDCYLKLLGFEVVTDANHLADVLIGGIEEDSITMRRA